MVRGHPRQTTALLGMALAVVATLGSTTTAVATGRALYRPTALGSPLTDETGTTIAGNPPRNLAPSPDYRQTCASGGWRDRKCVAQALAAIEHARISEGVRRARMVLPNNYGKLDIAEQTFVITNLERTARALKPFTGMTASLDTASELAAGLRLDPAPAISLLRQLGLTEYGSVWAGDFGPLASDYDWMYNDGYSRNGSINVDCPRPRAAGCWGHRDIILGLYNRQPTLLAGAGTGRPAGASIAEVLAAGNGRPPHLTYTWRQAVRHGAANTRPTAGS